MASKSTQRSTVLIVDDDVILRDVLSLLLGAEGYVVLLAESGDQALELLLTERDNISVVLTDMHMPGANGAALAKKLKAATAPETALIGMSGSQPQPEEKAAFKAFLEKPFSVNAFSNAVEQALTSQFEQAEIFTPAHSTVTVLNEEIYSRLASIMSPQQVRDLYRMTLDDVRRRIALMRQAATRGDDQTCRAEAHAIKGGCGMVGAAELSALASEVERSPEPHLAPFADFDAACRRLEDMLNARAGSPMNGE